MLSDYECYFIVDKQLAEAPLLEDKDKVLVRKWLQIFVDTKMRGASQEVPGGRDY